MTNCNWWNIEWNTKYGKENLYYSTKSISENWKYTLQILTYSIGYNRAVTQHNFSSIKQFPKTQADTNNESLSTSSIAYVFSFLFLFFTCKYENTGFLPYVSTDPIRIFIPIDQALTSLSAPSMSPLSMTLSKALTQSCKSLAPLFPQ